MFDMANDSGIFKSKAKLLADGYLPVKNQFQRGDELFVPLYEAKMANIFNHRHSDYRNAVGGDRAHILPRISTESLENPDDLAIPCYWVPALEVADRLREKSWDKKWLLGWRDVTDARASVRTLIPAVIPAVGVNHKFLLMLPKAPLTQLLALIGNLSSLVCDYIARQKVGGLSLPYFILKQLPILSPGTYKSVDLDKIGPRVLELIFTAQDLQPFYEDVIREAPTWDSRSGNERGKPWRWDAQRRSQLQAELDAIFARLYGLSKDDLRFILDPKELMGQSYPSETFRVLQDRENRVFGEYRTRRLVLEAWDRMEAMELV